MRFITASPHPIRGWLQIGKRTGYCPAATGGSHWSLAFLLPVGNNTQTDIATVHYVILTRSKLAAARAVTRCYYVAK
jgi:hypothetical protein